MTGGGAVSGRVSAVVVNHNAGEALRGCVESLRSEGVDNIVVVDNASTDTSIAALLAAHPSVTVVRAGYNLGYGAGVNAGARAASHDILLVCNPDLILHGGAVGTLVASLDASGDVAVAGPRILTPVGAVYPSAREFPTLGEAIGHAFVGLFSEHNPWTQRYKLRGSGTTSSAEADWVSGACFAVRREAFASVGGFDEAYFMYMEDVDICWRLRRAGWRVVYEPSAVVTHLQGLSTSRRPYRMIAAHHESMWRFARRTSRGSERLLLPLVAAGICVRFLLACAKQATAH